MSYTSLDAKIEFDAKLDGVLQTRDVEGAYELAQLLKMMGDDEEAEMFLKTARQWERDDNWYDEQRDNNN